MSKASSKWRIFALQHTDVQTGKNGAQPISVAPKISVPRLSTEIQNNRWRAFTTGSLIELDPDVEKFVRGALKAILNTNIIVDQRDIYYSLRMGHPDWKLAGHPLKTEEAYNTFVGQIMEKVQLATGYTMQSLGVRAGPRGYITGDDRTYFILPDGRKIPVNASPVIQFNLVDEGVTLSTQARKLIHYEKAAGLNSLIINDLPLMLECLVMTSQGYNVEAATKMHADMEKRGLPLYVLGDADPHGMSIQLMYGRASKSNSYMPDSFYPRNAVLLGLFPRIAKELNLPPEHVGDIHMRVVPNLKKIMQEIHPDMLADAEIFEKDREQWEWQSLNGLDPLAPAIYEIEALYARNNEIKYVPTPAEVKKAIEDTIQQDLDDFVNDSIESYARDWLMANLKPKLVQQLKEDLEGDIAEFKSQADEEMEILRKMKAEDLREAIKLKLVKNPKQYWTDACRKVISDILAERFDITATIKGDVDTERSGTADAEVKLSRPEVPEQPLEKHDIIEAIEKRVTTTKKALIQKLRDAIQKVLGIPSEVW
jgi:DNA topoisomerase VI subunit A